MRRIVTVVLTTVTVVVLLFSYRTSTSSTLPAASPAAEPPQTSPATSTGAAPGTSSGASAGASAGSGSGAGGTVTGDAVATQWGPVQVRLSIDGGRISTVDVVEYPQGNPRDQQINAYALPILIQETLTAQSADIDMVSGATVTSTGYEQSLQSALDRADL